MSNVNAVEVLCSAGVQESLELSAPSAIKQRYIFAFLEDPCTSLLCCMVLNYNGFYSFILEMNYSSITRAHKS